MLGEAGSKAGAGVVAGFASRFSSKASAVSKKISRQTPNSRWSYPALDHPHLVRVAGGVAPESIVLVFAPEIARQHGFTTRGFHTFADPVETRRTNPAVEFFGVELDVLEIMGERLLADELVNGRDRPLRLGGQRLIGQRQQAGGLLAANASRSAFQAKPTMPLGAANPSTREYTVPPGSKLKMPDG